MKSRRSQSRRKAPKRKAKRAPAAKRTKAERAMLARIEAAAADAFKRFEARVPEIAPLIPRAPLKITDEMVAGSMAKRSRRSQRKTFINAFIAAKPHPGVVPDGSDVAIAMDDAITESIAWAGAYGSAGYGLFWGEDTTFLGFPVLAELAQRPEYRRISEVIATEMTRKWITLKASGDTDKTDKIKIINQRLDELKAKDRFREIAEQDGFFGRSHLYLDIGENVPDAELKMSIGGGRDALSKLKVSRENKLTRLKVVEPVWCYPSVYDTRNPLAKDWYSPSSWYVMGREVHGSRLLTFVGREVPDILKPAYSFGGLSLSQMAKPYVDNFIRTRQSVSDLISSFSVMALMTDMGGTLGLDGSKLFTRVDMFNNLRDNRNAWVLDKTTEDIKNLTTPLSTLDVLLAQSQEQICSVSGLPVVKYTGIQPAGLNADSEGIIRTFYDFIAAHQEKIYRDKLTRVIDFVQLSEWGEVDPEITCDFNPLWSLDEKGEAEVDKIEAETDAVRIDSGVIGPEEVRTALAADPKSKYHGLDPDDLPEPEPVPGEGGEQPLAPGEEPADEQPQPKAKPEVGKDAVIPFVGAADEFEESKHPRDHGKFTSAGGSGGKGSKPEAGSAPLDVSKLTKVGSQKGGDDAKLLHNFIGVVGGKRNAKYVLQGAETRVRYNGLALSTLEAAHIMAYSGSHSGEINEALRGGNPTLQQRLYAKALNDSLAKLPPYKGESFRGASLRAAEVGAYTEGVVIEERAFTSSSSESTEKSRKGNTQFVFQGKSGRDISRLSYYSEEREIVFPAGTLFKVRKVRKVGKTTTINLEQI